LPTGRVGHEWEPLSAGARTAVKGAVPSRRSGLEHQPRLDVGRAVDDDDLRLERLLDGADGVGDGPALVEAGMATAITVPSTAGYAV
jgi:hypothetical protein